MKPWGFRKGLGYLLRTQDDYSDVFQLKRFIGKQADWKPYLSHLLGFKSEPLVEQYKLEAELVRLKEDRRLLAAEMDPDAESADKLAGRILLKQRQLNKIKADLQKFDFHAADDRITAELVDDIDAQISRMNAARYSLRSRLARIASAIEPTDILFEPDAIQRLFDEANVAFEGQLKHDFDELVQFNRSIAEERRGYLVDERQNTENRLDQVMRELSRLNSSRADALSQLSEVDVFEKFKERSAESAAAQAELINLEFRRERLASLERLSKEIQKAEDAHELTIREVEDEWRSLSESTGEETYGRIRIFFDEIVRAVIDQDALLSITINSKHHFEFNAEILNKDAQLTDQAGGHSYKKLLCVAFDLAVIRAHLDVSYPRFAFHDGVFESLDPRKKSNLLDVIRTYESAGIQQIVTLIDSDAPPPEGEKPAFSDEEIVLRLHDEGDDGRLFRMPAW